MNKKYIARISVLMVVLAVLSVFAVGCKKTEKSEVETPKTAESAQNEAPVTTGPAVAFNELGEPEFETEASEENEIIVINRETTAATEPEVTESADSQNNTNETTVSETEPEAETEEALSEYEKYLNMSGSEQTAFIESFETPADFFNWLNDAKGEYEAANPGIPVGDGVVDLEKIN